MFASSVQCVTYCTGFGVYIWPIFTANSIWYLFKKISDAQETLKFHSFTGIIFISEKISSVL